MIGISLNLRNDSNLGRFDIIPILSLPIHEHGIPVQRFRCLLSLSVCIFQSCIYFHNLFLSILEFVAMVGKILRNLFVAGM